MVTIDGKETVAQVTRHGYSILNIYEHALKAYTKLFSHIAKLLNTPERKNVLKTGKKKQYHNIEKTVQTP